MGKRGPQPKPGKRDKYGRLTEKAREELRKSGFDKEQQDIMAPGIEARMRKFGLTAKQSKGQDAGSVIGRMKQAGNLSPAQYEAAITFIRQQEDYHKARSGPKQPNAMDLNRVFGLNPVDEQEQAKRDKRAAQRYEAAMKAVQGAQDELRGGGNLWGALELYLVKDKHIWTLEGDLKIALNALARHYRLTGVLAA